MSQHDPESGAVIRARLSIPGPPPGVDEEMWNLGWAAAGERGARQSRPVNFDVERMRRHQQEADDPLGLDEEPHAPVGPLTDEQRKAFVQGLAGYAAAAGLFADLAPWMVSVATALYEGLVAARPVLDAALQALSTLGDAIIGEGVVPDVQHRRHGTAAVCPRHGPTVGGMCRRCTRRRR